MSERNIDSKIIMLEVTPKELRYFVSCGFALIQNIPDDSLPTYCGLNKDEIIEVSLRLRELAEKLGVDF